MAAGPSTLRARRGPSHTRLLALLAAALLASLAGAVPIDNTGGTLALPGSGNTESGIDLLVPDLPVPDHAAHIPDSRGKPRNGKGKRRPPYDPAYDPAETDDSKIPHGETGKSNERPLPDAPDERVIGDLLAGLPGKDDTKIPHGQKVKPGKRHELDQIDKRAPPYGLANDPVKPLGLEFKHGWDENSGKVEEIGKNSLDDLLAGLTGKDSGAAAAAAAAAEAASSATNKQHPKRIIGGLLSGLLGGDTNPLPGRVKPSKPLAGNKPRAIPNAPDGLEDLFARLYENNTPEELAEIIRTLEHEMPAAPERLPLGDGEGARLREPTLPRIGDDLARRDLLGGITKGLPVPVDGIADKLPVPVDGIKDKLPFPADELTGSHPTGGLPTGGLPTGALPTGGLPTLDHPTLYLPEVGTLHLAVPVDDFTGVPPADGLPARRGLLDGITDKVPIPIGGITDTLPVGGITDLIPVDGITDKLPVDGITDKLPVDGVKDKLPVDGLPVDLPTGGLPTGALPTGGLPTGGLGGALPTGVLPIDGIASILPIDPVKDIAGKLFPRGLLDGITGKLPLPVDGITDKLPVDGITENLPIDGITDKLPVDSVTDDLPVPVGTLPTGSLPTGAIPIGGLPTGGALLPGILPIDDVAGALPVGDISGGLPDTSAKDITGKLPVDPVKYITGKLPLRRGLFDGITNKLPDPIDGIINNIPDPIDGITNKLPVPIDGVTDKLPVPVEGITDKLPLPVGGITDALPVGGITDALPLPGDVKETLPVDGVTEKLPLVRRFVNKVTDMLMPKTPAVPDYSAYELPDNFKKPETTADPVKSPAEVPVAPGFVGADVRPGEDVKAAPEKLTHGENGEPDVVVDGAPVAGIADKLPTGALKELPLLGGLLGKRDGLSFKNPGPSGQLLASRHKRRSGVPDFAGLLGSLPIIGNGKGGKPAAGQADGSAVGAEYVTPPKITAPKAPGIPQIAQPVPVDGAHGSHGTPAVGDLSTAVAGNAAPAQGTGEPAAKFDNKKDDKKEDPISALLNSIFNSKRGDLPGPKIASDPADIADIPGRVASVVDRIKDHSGRLPLVGNIVDGIPLDLPDARPVNPVRVDKRALPLPLDALPLGALPLDSLPLPLDSLPLLGKPKEPASKPPTPAPTPVKAEEKPSEIGSADGSKGSGVNVPVLGKIDSLPGNFDGLPVGGLIGGVLGRRADEAASGSKSDLSEEDLEKIQLILDAFKKLFGSEAVENAKRGLPLPNLPLSGLPIVNKLPIIGGGGDEAADPNKPKEDPPVNLEKLPVPLPELPLGQLENVLGGLGRRAPKSIFDIEFTDEQKQQIKDNLENGRPPLEGIKLPKKRELPAVGGILGSVISMVPIDPDQIKDAAGLMEHKKNDRRQLPVVGDAMKAINDAFPFLTPDGLRELMKDGAKPSGTGIPGAASTGVSATDKDASPVPAGNAVAELIKEIHKVVPEVSKLVPDPTPVPARPADDAELVDPLFGVKPDGDHQERPRTLIARARPAATTATPQDLTFLGVGRFEPAENAPSPEASMQAVSISVADAATTLTTTITTTTTSSVVTTRTSTVTEWDLVVLPDGSNDLRPKSHLVSALATEVVTVTATRTITNRRRIKVTATVSETRTASPVVFPTKPPAQRRNAVGEAQSKLALQTITLNSQPTTVSVSGGADVSIKGDVRTDLGGTSPCPVGPAPEPTGSLVMSKQATVPSTLPAARPAPAVANIFDVSGASNPRPAAPVRSDHPVRRNGISGDSSVPVGTNKFYGNLLVEDRNLPVWTTPYSVWWPRGRGATGSWGLAVSHVEQSQLTFGPTVAETGAAEYYINPTGIESIVLSAAEIDSGAQMSVRDPGVFGVWMDFYPESSERTQAAMSVPLVQGMGFVTARYRGNATPIIRSALNIRSVDAVAASGSEGVSANTGKFRLALSDGTVWLVYLTADDGRPAAGMPLVLAGSNTVTAPAGFRGFIQVAKLPVMSTGTTAVSDLSISASDNDSQVNAERSYDRAAGVYPVEGRLAASSDGTYTIDWTREGGQSDQPLLMFALPHHLKTLAIGSGHGEVARTDLRLRTTVKGTAAAVLGNKWTLQVQMPTDIDLAPTPPRGAGRTSTQLSADQKRLIAAAARRDLAFDVARETNSDSFYFSGKAIAKVAMIGLAAQAADELGVAGEALDQLRRSLGVFVRAENAHPLAYDATWGGLVSTSGFADAGADFGNTLYNDHHFHFGYLVYSAAVLARLDPAWLTADGGRNRAWVDDLVRDYANPATDDPYFPFSRNFDWFAGHSWAKGLFASADGKDEESTSEDAFSAYAVMMWGRATSDATAEHHGALMLGLLGETIPTYFFFPGAASDGTDIHPAQFRSNGVSGILFENKVHYATYFGADTAFIHGIQMLPLSPATETTRPADLVRAEWNARFSGGRAENRAPGGWRAILYGNIAYADPRAAYEYFARPDFDNSAIDGGASRAWYLAFAGSRLNAQ